MPKCHKFYPNCQWTVTQFWPDLALNTVLLTKVYWSYSTNIVRVCFTPLLQTTFQQAFKHKQNFQIKFNSPAMASLYEVLCYHSLEHSDAIMDEFITYIQTILSPFLFFPETSAVLPDTTDDNFNGS